LPRRRLNRRRDRCPHPEERALARVSKDELPLTMLASWFETAPKRRLLTMRGEKTFA
jgi:hypothetical protein